MSDEELRRILRDAEAKREPAEWMRAALAARRSAPDERSGLCAYAAVLDQAYGLAAESAELAEARRLALDALAVTEHGMRFRFVPEGAFLMGSERGEPDERPIHRVTLDRFWISETPVSWQSFCSILGWGPPPQAVHQQRMHEREGQPVLEVGGREVPLDAFALALEDRVRVQYCEDQALRAHDWHAHWPQTPGSAQPFGQAPRAQPETAFRYAEKPMVAISWHDAQLPGERISTEAVLYRLPTEAEWEKAARGGLVGKRYPWGDEPPTPERCDFGRFREFVVRPPRQLPPNGYGLFGMSGGVWEWTLDRYDSQYYVESANVNPTGPTTGSQRVLRGGSWADDAGVVTVSFRMARGPGQSWVGRGDDRESHVSPTIGFRLCRIERGSPPRA